MSYAVAQDLIDRYGALELIQLADRDGDGGWDADVVARALSDTDAEIDAALASRYPLPLATVPQLLVGLAADITRYRLYVEAAPERVKDAAANARKILGALASGAMSLGLPAASQPAPANMARVSASSPTFCADEGF